MMNSCKVKMQLQADKTACKQTSWCQFCNNAQQEMPDRVIN